MVTSTSIKNESTDNTNALLESNFTIPRISSVGSEEHSDYQAKTTTMLNSPSRSAPARIAHLSVFNIAKELGITIKLPKGDQTCNALRFTT